MCVRPAFIAYDGALDFGTIAPIIGFGSEKYACTREAVWIVDDVVFWSRCCIRNNFSPTGIYNAILYDCKQQGKSLTQCHGDCNNVHVGLLHTAEYDAMLILCRLVSKEQVVIPNKWREDYTPPKKKCDINTKQQRKWTVDVFNKLTLNGVSSDIGGGKKSRFGINTVDLANEFNALDHFSECKCDFHVYSDSSYYIDFQSDPPNLQVLFAFTNIESYMKSQLVQGAFYVFGNKRCYLNTPWKIPDDRKVIEFVECPFVPGHNMYLLKQFNLHSTESLSVPYSCQTVKAYNSQQVYEQVEKDGYFEMPNYSLNRLTTSTRLKATKLLTVSAALQIEFSYHGHVLILGASGGNGETPMANVFSIAGFSNVIAVDVRQMRDSLAEVVQATIGSYKKN